MVKIFTGQRDSGKTLYLKYLTKDNSNFTGFLTFKKFYDDEFVGYDLYSLEEDRYYEFITNEDREGIKLDKFTFLEEGIAKGKEIIKNSLDNDKVLVIDEIGQLELTDEIFHDELKEALEKKEKVYVVVRRSLLNRFIEKYDLRDYTIVKIG